MDTRAADDLLKLKRRMISAVIKLKPDHDEPGEAFGRRKRRPVS